MATYFVASGGSNTAPYDTWAKAATSLQTALTAATTTGDLVILQYNAVPSGDAEFSTDGGYSFAGNIALISASNDGGTAWTPTPMGSNYWVGHSTSNREVSLHGTYSVYFYGMTFRTAGSISDPIHIGIYSDGGHYAFDTCYIWHGNTSGVSRIYTGSTSGQNNTYVLFNNCTFRFGNVNQAFVPRSPVDMVGCSISLLGEIPSLFIENNSTSAYVNVTGCDLSAITGTLVGSFVDGCARVAFSNCRLNPKVSPLSTQSIPNKSSALVELYNCSSIDQHFAYGYYDAFGSVTATTDIRAVDGASYDGTQRYSWKIVTTANCSFYTPFVTPWFGTYHNGTTPISPYVEVLRNGSSTPFTDAEVWGEYSTQETYGSTLATIRSGRMALNGVAEAHPTGIGAYNWQGWYDGTWSGKLSCPAKVLPQAPGDLKARICVGAASTTLYVDPQVRT